MNKADLATECSDLADECEAAEIDPTQYNLSELSDLFRQARDTLRDAAEALGYDPTPWCHICGAREQKQCKCGPYARNH